MGSQERAVEILHEAADAVTRLVRERRGRLVRRCWIADGDVGGGTSAVGVANSATTSEREA